MGAPMNVSQLALTGQTGAIASRIVHQVVSAGLFRISAYAVISTAGLTGAVSVTVTWNDGVQAQSKTIILSLALLPLGTFDQATFVLRSAAGQAISVASSVASLTGSPQYSLYVNISEEQ